MASADRAVIKACSEAPEMTLSELTNKERSAILAVTHWRGEVAELKEAEGGFLAFFTGPDSEEIQETEATLRQWQAILGCLRKELAVRIKETPDVVAAAQAEVAERFEGARQRSRERFGLDSGEKEPGIVASAIGSVFETVAEIGAAVTEGGASTVETVAAPLTSRVASFYGFGKDQTAEARAAGLFKLLLLLIAVTVVVYLLSKGVRLYWKALSGNVEKGMKLAPKLLGGL